MAIWSADSPPDHNRTAAVAARITPQIALTPVLGFNFPPVVSMPSTNVPESAEVTKKDVIKSTAIPMTTVAAGVTQEMQIRLLHFPFIHQLMDNSSFS